MTEFKREIRFYPAFDKRDPDPDKNYGIRGVQMRWLLSGNKGVVQFVLATQWYLPHVQKELELASYPTYNYFAPIPMDLGYHSLKPMYDGHPVTTGSCEYLDGKPCYYDGSGLNAEDIFRILVSQGGEAVWVQMEYYYHELFD